METNSLIDMKLNNEQEFEKKDKIINELNQKILELQEKIKDKDLALNKMGDTIFSKGVENKRLVEIINEFKNEHLKTKIMGQKFSVQKLGKLKNEDCIVRNYFSNFFSLDSQMINPQRDSTSQKLSNPRV